jgi:hypothetical protein
MLKTKKVSKYFTAIWGSLEVEMHVNPGDASSLSLVDEADALPHLDVDQVVRIRNSEIFHSFFSGIGGIEIDRRDLNGKSLIVRFHNFPWVDKSGEIDH